MNASTQQFLQTLDRFIDAKHLLKHPFYLAWSKGELSIECLKEYAKEYYHHVIAFPTYLSSLHSRVENAQVRRTLLQNLIEEEAGTPNHPELWKQFALTLGCTEQELASHSPNIDVQAIIAEFRKTCREGAIVDGLASLYAYESQIPAICISKIEGLRKYYGITDPAGFKYFSVHIAADETHAAEEKELLSQLITNEHQESALEAADRILDSLQNFLTGLCQKFQISCSYLSETQTLV